MMPPRCLLALALCAGMAIPPVSAQGRSGTKMQKAGPDPASLSGFNRLESAVYDPATGEVELIGRRDPDAPAPIPYDQVLNEALSFPRPQFSLDSDFSHFTRSHIAGKSLEELLFQDDSLTPFARVTLSVLNIQEPPHANRAGYVGAVLRQAGFSQAADLREAVVEHDDRLANETLTRWIEILQLVPDFEAFHKSTGGNAANDPEAADTFYLRLLRGLAGSLEGSGTDIASLYRQARNSGGTPDQALKRSLQAFLDSYNELLVRSNDILLERRDQAAIVYSAQDLGVAFGTAPVSHPKFMNLDGSTQLGRLLLEGDYALKSVPFNARLTRIDGYQTFSSWADAYIDRSDLGTSRETRYWITVGSVERRLSTDGNVATIGNVAMKVESRSKGIDEAWSAERIDPVTQAYADLLTENFDAIAARVPELYRLRETAKVLTLADWVRSKGQRQAFQGDSIPYSAPGEVTGFLAMMPYLRQGTVLWGIWPSGGVDFDFSNRIVTTVDPSLTSDSVRNGTASANNERRERALAPIEARGLKGPQAQIERVRLERSIRETDRVIRLSDDLRSSRDVVATLNAFLLETQKLQAAGLRDGVMLMGNAAGQLEALENEFTRLPAADRAAIGAYLDGGMPTAATLQSLAEEAKGVVSTLQPQSYYFFNGTRITELVQIAANPTLIRLREGLAAWTAGLGAMQQKDPQLFQRLGQAASHLDPFLQQAGNAETENLLQAQRAGMVQELVPGLVDSYTTNQTIELIIDRQISGIEAARRQLDTMRS